jgi:chromate reductase, NAD(P)H dehydrogenase (quinone)
MIKWLLTFCLIVSSSYVSAETKILAFSGSTREDSLNKKLLKEACKIAQQQGAVVKVVDLRDYSLPFYNGDLEISNGMPENGKKLRRLMIESDALLIASPEYNASISGVLKNVIDWASRSEDGKPSKEAFKGKKIGLLSISPGQGGGARGLEHLRAILNNVGAEVLKDQVAVPNAYEAFNSDGSLKNPALQDKLKKEVQQL